jgi:hypothetical protein
MAVRIGDEAPEQVSGSMKVAEVIRRHPATIEVFLACGCPDMRRGLFSVMARLMSVRAAARVHGLELKALLADLNKAARGTARSAREAS